MESHTPRVLVLGIGNILWADEGFGVRAVEEFHRRFRVPDDVTVLDAAPRVSTSSTSSRSTIVSWCSTRSITGSSRAR